MMLPAPSFVRERRLQLLRGALRRLIAVQLEVLSVVGRWRLVAARPVVVLVVARLGEFLVVGLWRPLVSMMAPPLVLSVTGRWLLVAARLVVLMVAARRSLAAMRLVVWSVVRRWRLVAARQMVLMEGAWRRLATVRLVVVMMMVVGRRLPVAARLVV